MRRPFSLLRPLIWLLVCSMLAFPSPAEAQVADSATLTILRGTVAVVHPDGSAEQPAASGTTVRVGDQIRTLDQTGALITFFSGTEIELGEQTVLQVDQIERSGDQVRVSLQQLLGQSLSRTVAFTNPGSAYRIEAGGAVALIRGTTFMLLGPTPEGIVVLLCLDDCDARSTFAGVPLGPYIGYWALVEQGQLIQAPQAFNPDPLRGYWNAAFEAATAAAKELKENEPSPDDEQDDDDPEDDDDDPPPHDV